MGATQMPATKSSWSPYAQLIWLEKLVCIVIIHFTYVVGSLYAACLSQPKIALQDVARINFLLLCGTFLLRSWACAWDDIVDRDLDKLVERCKRRPMASGKLSVRNAFLFTGFLCFVWIALMKSLVSSFLTHGVALIVFSGVYPFTKRFTAYILVWLGLTFAWGVLVGFAAMGLDFVQLLLSSEESDPTIKGALLLFIYYTIWAVIFETVYAFQDLPDDTKAGINSMAVLEASSLYYSGPPFFNIVMLFRMVTGIDFRSAEQCRWWFSHDPLMAGAVLIGSLCIEYLGRMGMVNYNCGFQYLLIQVQIRVFLGFNS
ncbi:a34dd6f3-6cb7-4c87-9909-58799b3a4eea [Sclerotinia trifoliorum]|uniref:A34dd6f3-6cb7-4c87-9909-58799b3a4eea n=1 Tax=Sclerotinia trifoliorum TaxID=28548 RepID=A0A8H2ZLX2_9HELO|nr:a34dd6f3-6cb7-4c87-9909-58799b3a4eea [Sclerotinia trifoliorum]